MSEPFVRPIYKTKNKNRNVLLTAIRLSAVYINIRPIYKTKNKNRNVLLTTIRLSVVYIKYLYIGTNNKYTNANERIVV